MGDTDHPTRPGDAVEFQRAGGGAGDGAQAVGGEHYIEAIIGKGQLLQGVVFLSAPSSKA